MCLDRHAELVEFDLPATAGFDSGDVLADGDGADHAQIDVRLADVLRDAGVVFGEFELVLDAGGVDRVTTVQVGRATVCGDVVGAAFADPLELDGGPGVDPEAGGGERVVAAVARRADFDGDGTARIPIIDGSQNILLVDHNGNTVTLGGGGAAKSPLGTADLDLDGSPEIYYARSNGRLRFIDDVTNSNTVKDVTDAQNNQPRGERETGVA